MRSDLGQGGLTEVQLLPVVENLDVADVEPWPSSIRKVSGSQLGRLTMLSFSTVRSAIRVTRRLYKPDYVGAGVVDVVGDRFRSRTPSGESPLPSVHSASRSRSDVGSNPRI